MIILGIETSCDETSVALVEGGKRVIKNVVLSQVKDHAPYGGVVPEIASRKHLEGLLPLISQVLSGFSPKDIDGVAVTVGPGLIGSLTIGLMFAKTLAWIWKKPLLGVNHLEAHVYALFLEYHELSFPFLCLLVSGGHTELFLFKDHGDFELVGETRDDAAGEAFDKVARILNLPYPGGPAIDEISKKGDPYFIEFPYPLEEGLDFSFSGIKTAVRLFWEENKGKVRVEDVAASFQRKVVEILIDKLKKGALLKRIKRIALVGGVVANSLLRSRLRELQEEGFEVFYPSISLCTDNAAMVASAGYYELKRERVAPLTITAHPNLKIGEDFLRFYT
ncbi:MAG: tRNA (adenosine(37)-N6)-threonylcarbamoyltransferase complex transferase subunit TsaD [Synergistetes bacterium]|nr:tRNA (adenosine(37)-N6)-threonylcarbamoyltransferase complex transferase subunit TsaD [Synergistota bacterium]MCX8128351.1 tRNA (adenosine(37)-N6)-threonylcarbamoyltransferase complex transferase subunit TsaD [Synergistota bacterium]MDW8192991.1 tRNA (adenosine(37)-N6)-threonylcarbamoyltransferase complex transferase subunit TsaD [Synergistota bacterium]